VSKLVHTVIALKDVPHWWIVSLF